MIVYLVVNKINNKVYVGQTVRKFNERKRNHLSSARNGSQLPFHHAIRKYGIGNFTWEIIYEATSLQDLNEAEEYLIAEYNSRSKDRGYNINFGGDNRIMPDDVKGKIRAALKGRRRSIRHQEKISAAKRGCKHSTAARMKMSIAQTGRKHSVETRSKIGIAQVGAKNHAFDPRIYPFFNASYGIIGSTKRSLIEKYNLDKSAVYAVANGKWSSCKGWILASNMN